MKCKLQIYYKKYIYINRTKHRCKNAVYLYTKSVIQYFQIHLFFKKIDHRFNDANGADFIIILHVAGWQNLCLLFYLIKKVTTDSSFRTGLRSTDIF